MILVLLQVRGRLQEPEPCVSSSSSRHPEISTLYIDHHHWLQGWLRRKVGNAFDAADLAQDTFVRILGARDLPSIETPRAYLTTVAKGVLVNWCRRQALERAYLEALAQLPEPEAPSPEQRAVVLETLHEIDAMLDALPPLVRRAFLLSQLDGMKYEDIARQLGVSLTSVKRYMAQAFRQCLALMEE
ncbi:MAG: sigma-70 family RNA polymerase sigma factor [Comamonas sp.]|nr:sigma-70 family RNA polymerase sigma factor [Comamonas sp.]